MIEYRTTIELVYTRMTPENHQTTESIAMVVFNSVLQKVNGKQ